MKKKVKFTLRMCAIWLCAMMLCSTTQPGSLLFVVTLMVAIFASCTANAAYEDEKAEELIEKQNQKQLEEDDSK